MPEKTTSAQKKLRGTTQKCRVKSNPTYNPIDFIPEPLDRLEANGLTYFNNFCSILMSAKLLTLAYVPAITRAARWYEQYVEADEGCRKHGSTQITSTGYTQMSGYMSTKALAEDRMTKIEDKFGLSLAANLRLDIPKAEKENPFTTL